MEVERVAEKDYFNQKGAFSSDVYYINHDKKVEAVAQAKGGARVVADELRVKHSYGDDLKRKKMEKEANERQKVLAHLQTEDDQAKTAKLNKKMELRKVMDIDAKEKKDFKDRNTQMAKRSGGDFGDENVLSYVYQKKEHQSYKLSSKNDYVVNLIHQKFQSTDKIASHEAKTLQRDMDQINAKHDNTVKKRADDRKLKEVEAKNFQDKQVAEKMLIHKKEKQQVVKDSERIMK